MKEIAYHEAGHVVAALRLGIPVRLVSVRPREGHAGVSRLEAGGAHEQQGAIVLIAGSLAEKKALGHLVRFNWFFDDHDATMARELVDAIAGEDGDVLDIRRLVEVQARALRVTRWAAVEALAAALQRHTVLTGEEAAKIVRPHLKKGDGDGNG